MSDTIIFIVITTGIYNVSYGVLNPSCAFSFLIPRRRLLFYMTYVEIRAQRHLVSFPKFIKLASGGAGAQTQTALQTVLLSTRKRRAYVSTFSAMKYS